MTNISDSDLLRYNHEGFIPGPGESEDAFLRRVNYCLNLPTHLAEDQNIPFPQESRDTGSALQEAYPLTEELFAIRPSWLPVFYSNYQLTPWHGGCAWIFQMDENSPKAAFLQLRKNFQDSETFLHIYRRDELIAHEVSHVGRMMFEEPRYEEMLAYRTSRSWFRRWLGPIVQTSTESSLFMMVLILIILLDIYLVATGQLTTYWLTSWAKAIPALMVGLALARLWNRHATFNGCLHKLESLSGDKHKANAVIYRLTDEEIEQFSRLSENEIVEYAQRQSSESLRWRLISLAYTISAK